MASETVKLFGKVELEYASTSAGTLRAWSDLPGTAMAERITPLTIPATTTRRQIEFRLPGVMKGHLLQLSYSPGAGTARLYRVRVWARDLPRGAWAWHPVYVPETSEEWQAVQIPVPPTSDQWQAIQIPVPPTSEQWSAVDLQIPGTPEEWSPVRMPVKETPLIPEWRAVEIDR